MQAIGIQRSAQPARPAADGMPAVAAIPARAQQNRPINTILRVHPPGEGAHGFMEIGAAVPPREAGVGPKGNIAAKPGFPAHVRFFKGTGLGPNQRQWGEVAAGEHLRNAEQFNFMEHPQQPLAPGLMAQRLRGIERK